MGIRTRPEADTATSLLRCPVGHPLGTATLGTRSFRVPCLRPFCVCLLFKIVLGDDAFILFGKGRWEIPRADVSQTQRRSRNPAQEGPRPGNPVLSRLPYNTPAIWSRSAGESLLNPSGEESPQREATRTAVLAYASRLAFSTVGSDGHGSLGCGRHFCHGGF